MWEGFFKKNTKYYILGVLFLILNAKAKTLVPAQLGKAIDLLKDMVGTGQTERSAVYRAAVMIFVYALLVFGTQFVWRMCVIGNARRMEIALRKNYFGKLQRLPFSFFAKQHSGDLVAMAINDVNAVRMMFGPVLAMSISGVATAIFSIVSMAGQIDGRMTVCVLIPVPVAIFLILWLGKIVQKRSRVVQNQFAELSGFVNESIMGVRVVKGFAKEGQWTSLFHARSEEMRDSNVRLNQVSALITPLVSICFGVCFAVSMIYGSVLVCEGSMSVGDLVAFQSYLLLVQAPILQIGRINNMIQRGMASYHRMKELFDQPDVPASEELPYDREIAGALRASHLSFAYEGADQPALQDVSFELQAGQMLGIAGTTGCGKTTLLSLLMKFYPVQRGQLFVDGVDINDIPAGALRDRIGYVAQDGFLFSTTIEDNIRFYQDGVSIEDVKHAAELASVNGDIDGFPEGYDTQVGERGTHLSGGQKQRISLARALVKNAKLLILDDTLSAVDHVTEQKIIAALDGVLKSTTSIVLSHRLSALTHADLILYMDEGRVVEQGTHEELMALGGIYAKTYQMQQEGGEQ